MAEVAPFRGLRYNPEKVPNMAEVVIPPYDVISPEEQKFYHGLNPYNMVRLELGETFSGDSESDNPHTRAARYLSQWQSEGALIRDRLPTIYYHELDYSLAPGVRLTRYGFICALKLEDFSAGGVRPHEKTFSAVKAERLGLMTATHANLSSVFSLYSDPDESVDRTLKAAREKEPVMAFTDKHGMEHRMWRVSDPEALRKVERLMRDRAIFIADGHHRYETALGYRNLQRERHKDASPRASFEYIMMYLSNLNQEGLTILPTHRLLRNLGAWEPEAVMKKAEPFFEILRFDANDERRWRAELEAGAAEKQNTIGCLAGTDREFWLLKTKPEAVSSYLTDRSIPALLHGLDVVVLDQVLLRGTLGLPDAFLGDGNNIHFRHDASEAILGVRSGAYEAAFVINSTRIEQVQDVASAGLVMPHKSTYFYPKVGSGMVVHLLDPTEEDGI
ncbi:MAG: DUF1015 domain-containing protein [Acidobacteriota bacterium]